MDDVIVIVSIAISIALAVLKGAKKKEKPDSENQVEISRPESSYEEGERSISQTHTDNVKEAEKTIGDSHSIKEKEKIVIDKKKLIIYSEIMKQKF